MGQRIRYTPFFFDEFNGVNENFVIKLSTALCHLQKVFFGNIDWNLFSVSI
jgi:hypothetical protein